MRRRSLLAVPAVVGSARGLAQSAEWRPTRPVRLVNPFAAGGPLDALIRPIAERAALLLGQPVVVENRVGAAGVVGVDHVAKAVPDGHTVLATSIDTQINNAVMIRDLPYDPVRDFAPITQLAYSPIILVAHGGLGVDSLAAFDALAKRPGQRLAYGSWGPGGLGHVMAELLNRRFGWDLPHVPYRGIAPLVTDLLAGQVAVGFASIAVTQQHVASGALRYLAVSGTQRAAQAPTVPTLGELGLREPVFETLQWLGLFAPAATPVAALRRLATEFSAVLEQPETRTRLASIAFEPVGGPPESFAATFARDHATLTAQIRALGIEGS